MTRSAFSCCRSGAAGGAALLLVGVAACGPSVQSIYEGNVRFEHCYRLDMDAAITPTHREACWSEWKNLYTYGQSRDRIDYADRRIRALSSGDYSRPNLDLDGGRNESVAASEPPIPANLHVAPPSTMPSAAPADAGAPAADAATEPEPAPPGAECARSCKDDWLECGKPCAAPADAGKDAGRDHGSKSAKSCKACDPDYKKCMRRCLK